MLITVLRRRHGSGGAGDGVDLSGGQALQRKADGAGHGALTCSWAAPSRALRVVHCVVSVVKYLN